MYYIGCETMMKCFFLRNLKSFPRASQINFKSKKVRKMSSVLDCAFECVAKLTEKYRIDDSHGLSHSICVLKFAEEIYRSEKEKHPYLAEQETVIFVAAVVHDMCDKKYVDEQEGIQEIRRCLSTCSAPMDPESLETVIQIISRMSYSTVKRLGFPDMGEYQLAYHIVREADLLAAYDIHRCIVFGIMVDKVSYTDSIRRAKELFKSRVLNYIDDDLFVTEYAAQKARLFHALTRDNVPTTTTITEV